MNVQTRWIGLPIAALIAACGGDTAQDDFTLDNDPSFPTTEQPAMGGQPMGQTAMTERADFQEIGGSGASGEVTVTDRANQTEVMVRIADTSANATLPGHIHSGTCDNIGAVVQPLQDITSDANGTGTMTTTVNLPPMAVMNGQHIVVYHHAGAPTACASIPAHSM